MPYLHGGGPVQQKILCCLRDNGPLTCQEISEKSGLKYIGVANTVRHMGTQGFVHRIGQRSGKSRRAAVWDITSAGVQVIGPRPAG